MNRGGDNTFKYLAAVVVGDEGEHHMEQARHEDVIMCVRVGDH